MPQNDPEPKRLTGERLDFVRGNRHEHPKKLAKALGVPVRHVERALRDLGDADALRRARIRRGGLGLVLTAALGGAGYATHLMMAARDKTTAAEEARRREAAAREAERRIYEVLDRRERGHDREVAKELRNDDEAVRLAAIRYLFTAGSGSELRSALDHIADVSSRVRLATIQLAGEQRSPSVAEALLTVATSREQGFAERALALEGLKRQEPRQVQLCAARLVPVCSDPNPTLRRATHEVLAMAFPAARVQLSPDPVALRASWQAVVEVRH
jgi:hypothetical protein